MAWPVRSITWAIADVSSTTEMALASEVFFVRAISTFVSGATTLRSACGGYEPQVCGNVSPIDRAASAWPTPTALMPERMASATNAPV